MGNTTQNSEHMIRKDLNNAIKTEDTICLMLDEEGFDLLVRSSELVGND